MQPRSSWTRGPQRHRLTQLYSLSLVLPTAVSGGLTVLFSPMGTGGPPRVVF